MFTYVVRRVLSAVPLLLLSSVLTFALVANSGDPLAQLRTRQPPVPPQVIELRARQLHLDEPQPVRYWIWLRAFAAGDMGHDVRGREVRPQLLRALGVTLRLVTVATLLAIVLALLAGVISAVRQYSIVDYVVSFAGFLFLAMPVFWLAALLKEYAAVRLNRLLGRQVVFTVGEQTPGLAGGMLARLGDQLGHLVLPTLVLALVTCAAWSRFQRDSMLDVLSSDYIRLARAKGLSRSTVLVRHALRTALIPFTTVVALGVGGLLSGAIVTESVFAWQGLGRLLVRAVNDRDVNLTLGWLMATSVFVVGCNLVADVLYGWLDPRIRSR
jgi:peptide/nickel transport system permease protein